MSVTLFPPQKLRFQVDLPASKSISNRALLICALAGAAEGRKADFTPLSHLSDCDDTRVMLKALTDMPKVIDVGAAGTAMRFLTAMLCITPGTRIITGTERMRHRPIGILVEALRALGAKVDYMEKEGYPPLRISGGLRRGGELSLPGHVSSQYVSALLMIAPVMEEGLVLHLEGSVVSRPYIEMTLGIMRCFGAKAAWEGESTLRVMPGGYTPRPYYIESDWSAASYWYEMMLLTQDPSPRLILRGLFAESLQGDSQVKEIFAPLGISTRHFEDEEKVQCVELTRKSCEISRFHYDFVHQPDLAQTLVASCALKGIHFHFTGLQSLKIKETDRISALCNELAKLGYVLQTDGRSTLSWEGQTTARPAQVALDTYEDHRMAMALAPACMTLGQVTINHPQVVSKSYPTFWESLQGFRMVYSEGNKV